MTFLDESGDDDDDDDGGGGEDDNDDEDGDGYGKLFSNRDLKFCQSLVFHKGVSAKCHSEKKFANSSWKKFKFAQICHSL